MDSSVRDLPPEIILIILEYLKSPIDVGNCVTACPDLLEELAVRHILGPQLCILASLDTNLKKKLKFEGWAKNSTDNGLIMSIWRKMEIYRDKVMLCFGDQFNAMPKLIEFYDIPQRLSKSDLSLQPRYLPTANLIQDKLIICGGADEYDEDINTVLFLSLTNQNGVRTLTHLKQTRSEIEIKLARHGASSIPLGDKIWIVGGASDGQNLKRTQLIESPDNTDKQPLASIIEGCQLPFKIAFHCSVQFDSNSVYLIGGLQNESRSKKTWIVNPKDINPNVQHWHHHSHVLKNIKKGPPLAVSREGAACGKFSIGGRVFIVIAGGYKEDSVELLDPLSDKGWILGPKLPKAIGYSAMITSPDGKGVLLFGGYDYKNSHESNEILELKGQSLETLKWIDPQSPQKLLIGRFGHIAIPFSSSKVSLK